MTHVLLQAAETAHHGMELPFNPFYYGLITFTIGLALLALLWSFRNTLSLDPVAHEGDHAQNHDESGRADGTTGSHR